MIEKHFIELMNKEIDGANSPDESAALRAYLKSSDEAMRHYEELRGVAKMFSEAGEVAVPPDLDRTIIRSIADREAARDAPTGKRSILDIFTPRKRLAYSFAAGLSCGLVLLIILLNTTLKTGRLDQKDLYGAFAGGARGEAVIATKHVSLATKGLSGAAAVQYREHSVTVILDLDASGEIEAMLTPAVPMPVESFSAPSCGAFDIHTSPTGLIVRISGRCGAAVTFRDKTGAHPALNISLESGGIRIFEQTIGRDENSTYSK